MATVITGRGSRDSLCSELDAEQRQRVESHAARIEGELAALRAERDFRSKGNAREMAVADVQNVEPLSAEDHVALIRRLEICNPKLARELSEAADQLWDWPEDDTRWELTPHELRRQRERQRQAV